MKHIFLILLAAYMLHSCSEYNNIIKADDYDKKFDYAGKMYDEKKWLKAVNLYEQVYQRSPRTPQGEVAYYRMGKSYFEVDDYYMAGYYLNSFAERFPNSIKAEECTFLSALCSVKNSPNYSLDQEETMIALNNLQNFIYKYPKSELIDTCNTIMDGLRFKLEYKAYEDVKVYDRTMKYQAAVVSAEIFNSTYPRSKYREEVYQIIVKNSYFLAINSVEEKKLERIEKSNERYLNFVSEFPNSAFRKTAESYREKLDKEYEIINTKK